MLGDVVALLQKDGVGLAVFMNESGEPDYDTMTWESDVHPRPTRKEFDAAVEKARGLVYREARRMAYPSVGEQLDILYHEGYEGWRESIQAVKDQFPKPPPA